MIIKSFRRPTSEGLGQFRDHIFRGEENVKVLVLRGTEADLADFRNLAVAKGAEFALRHFIISPKLPMSEVDLLAVVDDLANEFRFDPRICVVILHHKPRHAGEAETHLHVVVPEVDAATDGVLSSSNDFARQEKLARIVEHRHGHPFVEGAHMMAVLSALRKEGRLAVHQALEAAFPHHARPIEAFSTVNAQRVKRETGIDIAGLKVELQRLRKAGASPDAVVARLAEQGITLGFGDKPGTIVLSASGVHVAALHRLAGLRKETAFREFRHAATNATYRSVDRLSEADPAPSTEPRADDPPRDAGYPLVNRGDDSPHEPRFRRRRSGASHPRHADEPSEGYARHQSERGGPPHASRSVDTARARRRTLGAHLRTQVDDADRTRLAEEKRLASALARSASEVAADWLDDLGKALEAQSAALHDPYPVSSEVLEKAMHDEAVMRDVNSEHRRDIEQLEKAIADKETSLKASHRFWKKAVLSTPEIDRLRGDLKAANSRLASCETMRQQAVDAGQEERRSLANQAENQHLQRPSKLADLDKRRRALDELRMELTERPWTIFGGLKYLCRRLDQITDYLRRPRLGSITMEPDSGTNVGLPHPHRQ